jgi:hypothetical protein
MATKIPRSLMKQVMAAMGSKGGKRSLETMTAEERKARAKKASEAAAAKRTAAKRLAAKRARRAKKK